MSERPKPYSKPQWSIADVVYLEFFLERDEQTRRKNDGEALPDGRDREIYSERIESSDLWRDDKNRDTSDRRRMIFHAWLAVRREGEKASAHLPGELFESAQTMARIGFVVFGLILGCLDAKLASYFGTLRTMSAGVPEPANILWYLAGCVIFPAALVIGAILLFSRLARRERTVAARSTPSAIIRVFTDVSARPILWLMSKIGDFGETQSLAELRSIRGRILGRLKEQRSVIKWPFFITLQSFGVAFAIGVPLMTVLLMIGSYRGFGWQTSVDQITPVRVTAAVKVVSSWWRWIPFEWASQPDAENIQNSQVEYISGGKHLTDKALKSWWPFLVMCTLVYGLLPRLVLMGFAARSQRKALAGLLLDDSACDQLFNRMIPPRVEVESPPIEPSFLPVKPIQPPLHVPRREQPERKIPSFTPPRFVFPSNSCVVLISCDLEHSLTPHLDRLQKLLVARNGWQVYRNMFTGRSASGDREVLKSISEFAWDDGCPRLLYLEDASVPPIAETLDFLQQCRIVAGERSKVAVCLIGTPEPREPISAPNADNVSVWQNEVDTLGDTRIGVIRLTD